MFANDSRCAAAVPFRLDIRCDRLRDPTNGHFECEDYEELTPGKTCTLVCDRDHLPSGLVESLCFNWTDAGDNVKYNWTVQQEEFNCHPQVSETSVGKSRWM